MKLFKVFVLPLALSLALFAAMANNIALAQSAAPAEASKKSRAERAAELRAERAAKKAAAAKPAVEAPPPTADEDQMRATERVLFGEYECEFNQRLQVKLDPKYPGYANVTGVGVNFLMKPVASTTGAIRLEDVKNVGLLLQVAGKSMLMNVKTGQRVMDSCVHPDQVGTVKN
jgi:hypothetical protein